MAAASDLDKLKPELVLSTLLALVLGATIAFVVMQRRVRAAEARLATAQVNPAISKDEAKVVHTCQVSDVEDAGKVVYCRCWRSAKFPLCDGSHTKFNKESGDNVGPLIVAK